MTPCKFFNTSSISIVFIFFHKNERLVTAPGKPPLATLLVSISFCIAAAASRALVPVTFKSHHTASRPCTEDLMYDVHIII